MIDDAKIDAIGPLSVGEYIYVLKKVLQHAAGSVVGEVSQCLVAKSGHVYFTIKDKQTGDVLDCIAWRSAYALCGVSLDVGLEVVLKGAPDVYGPSGRMSFVCTGIELVGEGSLKKAYEKLKAQLAAEGLLDAVNKRPIPAFPKRIGVITSTQGAVIHDFNNNLRKSGFQVQIVNCTVEGPESGKDLALSVRACRKDKLDVLVIIRGGGSVQSLAGFNNERLVREIVAFPAPVIAGIGHHEDMPLAALVADAFESTPSMVASRLSSAWIEADSNVQAAKSTVFGGYQTALGTADQQLLTSYYEVKKRLELIFAQSNRVMERALHSYTKLTYAISSLRKDAVKDMRQILAAFLQHQDGVVQDLVSTEKLLTAHDPKRQLALGYSIARTKAGVLTSISKLRPGEIVQVQLADGSFESEITQVTK